MLIRFLERAKEKKFDDIRKEFCRKLGIPETIRFNLERGDRTKLLGMPTDAALANKDLFGRSWYDRPDAEKAPLSAPCFRTATRSRRFGKRQRPNGG